MHACLVTNQRLLASYSNNGMFNNLNFDIINTYNDLFTNLLLNKNDSSMYS